MNVEQLIEELELVEDKTRDVTIPDPDGGRMGVFNIDIDGWDDEVRLA